MRIRYELVAQKETPAEAGALFWTRNYDPGGGE